MTVRCSKTDHAARDAWAASHDLKLSPTRLDWDGFMNRRIVYRYDEARATDRLLRSGWDDHREVWNRDGKPACYSAQPYDLTQADRDNLETLARIHGLRVEIHPPVASWYYPGQTWLVLVWR